MPRSQLASQSKRSSRTDERAARRYYVVKAEVQNPRAKAFVFAHMKTMYGGKQVAKGDTIFVFASETEGGEGLVARGVVTKVEAVAAQAGVARQTPRVSIWVKRTASAEQPLGRAQLRAWRNLSDGSGQAELDFKLYRQATNKIIAVEEGAARVLLGRFSGS
ncbi:MAG: hypothetical protein ABW061_28335 [Polyangiaceae bacterium]